MGSACSCEANSQELDPDASCEKLLLPPLDKVRSIDQNTSESKLPDHKKKVVAAPIVETKNDASAFEWDVNEKERTVAKGNENIHNIQKKRKAVVKSEEKAGKEMQQKAGNDYQWQLSREEIELLAINEARRLVEVEAERKREEGWRKRKEEADQYALEKKKKSTDLVALDIEKPCDGEWAKSNGIVKKKNEPEAGEVVERHIRKQSDQELRNWTERFARKQGDRKIMEWAELKVHAEQLAREEIERLAMEDFERLTREEFESGLRGPMKSIHV